MATPSLDVTGITVISDAESTSGWTGDTFSLDPDVKVQGSNSVSCAQTSTGANDVYYAGSWDLTGGEHLRLWVNATHMSYIQNEANNGIQIWISDGSNTAYWTVGGSDTYAGGWRQFVQFTGATPTSGTVPTGNTTQIGVRFNAASKPRNVPANLWLDMWTYGDGYTVTGGTNLDPITMAGIASVDDASAYGIVRNVDGVIFIQGRVQIGNGATTTYLQDDGDVIVFADRPVATTLYELNYQGSGCDTVMNGGVITAAGTQNYKFIANTVAPNSFSVSGKQIAKASQVDLAAGQSVSGNSVFDACGQIEPSTATFTTNTVKNSTATGAGTGALHLPFSNNVDQITFDGNDRDVYIDDSGAYSEESFTHGTNNFDIDYNNASNASFSTPSDGDTATVTNTGAGTMTVTAGEVTLTLTGLQDGSDIVINTSDTNTPLHEVDANSGTTAGYTYTYSAGTYVDIKVYKAGYKPWQSYDYLLGNASASLPVSQVFDRAYGT